MSARSASDMASASGSSIIGLVGASSLHNSESRTRLTRSRSAKGRTASSEKGLPIPHAFTQHPKRKLHEVHYARHVGIPSGRVRPSPLGISTRLIGLGR